MFDGVAETPCDRVGVKVGFGVELVDLVQDLRVGVPSSEVVEDVVDDVGEGAAEDVVVVVGGSGRCGLLRG